MSCPLSTSPRLCVLPFLRARNAYLALAAKAAPKSLGALTPIPGASAMRAAVFRVRLEPLCERTVLFDTRGLWVSRCSVPLTRRRALGRTFSPKRSVV